VTAGTLIAMLHKCKWVPSGLVELRQNVSLDKTFVLFWGAYHAVSTVPYPLQGSQVTITPEKL
jgi:hypothetical protein